MTHSVSLIAACKCVVFIVAGVFLGAGLECCPPEVSPQQLAGLLPEAHGSKMTWTRAMGLLAASETVEKGFVLREPGSVPMLAGFFFVGVKRQA